MFLLLVSCGTIYLFLGDLREAIMVMGFVFVVVGITLYWERKTWSSIRSTSSSALLRAS